MNTGKLILLPLLLSLGLLGACGEQKEQIKQEFDNKFRVEFIEAFTRQCIDSIPQQTRLSADQKQSVCDCAARNAVETVSAAEITRAVSGNIPPELQNKLSTAVAPCLNNPNAGASAPASSASQP